MSPKIKLSKKSIRSVSEIIKGTILSLLVVSASFLALFVYFQINDNMAIMQELDSNEIKTELKTLLGKEYNYTELFQWEHDNLNFTWDSIDRHTNPVEIIEYGKGRCGEFAILYVALCLSQGYQCRLVSNVLGDHTWAEINLNGKWIHIDPTEQRVSDNYMYEKNWKVPIILICAFHASSFEDVTSSYKTGFWINILSLRMLALLSLIPFLLFFVLTYKDTRRWFYRQWRLKWRLKEGTSKSLGECYENHLHVFYIVRLLFTFFLPFSLIVFSLNVSDFSIILSLLVAGVALGTFASIQLPSLTQPKIFVSVWEHNGKKEIEHTSLKITKTENFVLRLRVANIGMHILKNCTFFVTFPPNVKIAEYQECWYKNQYKNEAFSREFTFQEVNNACVFSPSKGNTTLPPQDVIMLTVILKKIEPFAKDVEEKKRSIIIEVNSESTWGSHKEYVPMKE